MSTVNRRHEIHIKLCVDKFPSPTSFPFYRFVEEIEKEYGKDHTLVWKLECKTTTHFQKNYKGQY